MPFYSRSMEELKEGNYDLRNAWILETGEKTMTEFSYRQFVRNCKELRHFGYHFEGMHGYMPRYMGHFCLSSGRRVYSKCIELTIDDERFMAGELFRKVKCSALRLDFCREMQGYCSKSGEMVYLHIKRDKTLSFQEGTVRMWLSKVPEDSKDADSYLYDTFITYHFSEPVFGAVLEKYGLIKEEDKDAGIN